MLGAAADGTIGVRQTASGARSQDAVPAGGDSCHSLPILLSFRFVLSTHFPPVFVLPLFLCGFVLIISGCAKDRYKLWLQTLETRLAEQEQKKQQQIGEEGGSASSSRPSPLYISPLKSMVATSAAANGNAGMRRSLFPPPPTPAQGQLSTTAPDTDAFRESYLEFMKLRLGCFFLCFTVRLSSSSFVSWRSLFDRVSRRFFFVLSFFLLSFSREQREQQLREYQEEQSRFREDNLRKIELAEAKLEHQKQLELEERRRRLREEQQERERRRQEALAERERQRKAAEEEAEKKRVEEEAAAAAEEKQKKQEQESDAAAEAAEKTPPETEVKTLSFHEHATLLVKRLRKLQRRLEEYRERSELVKKLVGDVNVAMNQISNNARSIRDKVDQVSQAVRSAERLGPEVAECIMAALADKLVVSSSLFFFFFCLLLSHLLFYFLILSFVASIFFFISCLFPMSCFP